MNFINKTKLVSIIFLCITAYLGQAQHGDDFDYEGYSWEENRKLLPLTPEEEKEPALFLKDLQSNEYVYSENGQQLSIYTTIHKIIKVNTDDAIQRYNKVYIPMGNVIKLVDIKARSINRNGKSIILNKTNIKEVKDDEAGSGYKIFAIEGIEKGSEIEYYYIIKTYARYFGRAYFQSGTPAKNVSFELITPDNLTFACKGYNKFPVIQDTIRNYKRRLVAQADYVPGLKEEAFSNYNASRMRVEYKLAYNNIQGNNRLLTWENAAQRFYEIVYTLSKNDKKSIEKFYKSLKINGSKTLEEKVISIENYVKTNLQIQEEYKPELDDITYIINNKLGSKNGMVRLYAALFKEAGIKHELVLTSDRTDVKLDKDFESWNYLANYLFYFPETKQFFAPERADYRYGMIPYSNTHNYGLFVKSAFLGNYESVEGEVRFIPALDYKANFDTLLIDVRFDVNMNKANVKISKIMGGYSASYIQPFYSFLQDNKKKEVCENMIKSSAEDANFLSLKVKNGEPNISPLKLPFIIEAEIESSSIIETAGRKFLFKIGEMIGPQMELYQEEKRKIEVENDFNRLYDREIRFEIPKNYAVKNLDDLNMDIYLEEKGDRIFNFNSSYVVKDNIVTVKVVEYYKEIACSLDKFEDFRKVINAAANFNKITLVLEKQ